MENRSWIFPLSVYGRDPFPTSSKTFEKAKVFSSALVFCCIASDLIFVERRSILRIGNMRRFLKHEAAIRALQPCGTTRRIFCQNNSKNSIVLPPKATLLCMKSLESCHRPRCCGACTSSPYPR